MSENEWPPDTDPIVVEAVCALDRGTFEANPGMDEFLRPMALGEGPIPAAEVPQHVVRVFQIAPGFRVRDIRRGKSSRRACELFEKALAEQVALLLGARPETAS
jgi:hypothetical protein